MQKKDFNYDLPMRLIAQSPIEPRDASRMLVYDQKSGKTADKRFYDLLTYLKSGDVLVLNKTRVLPARIYGQKESGARVEFLLHKRKNYTEWETLARPAKRANMGDVFKFSNELSAEVTAVLGEGVRILRFRFNGVFEDILNKIGQMPLPHYIRETLKDVTRYQTVYASVDGSAAAPTAGLHFTPELLKKLESKGVQVARILLHVGLGTFRPVKAEDIKDHKMHTEYYEIGLDAAEMINAAKREGRRVIAVGTTSTRVLESVADEKGLVKPTSGETDIFIYPPYRFRTVDALITNFHLPESTLLMLVSAFIGHENALALYEEAVKKEYRFFSFGDACFLL